MLTIPLAQGCMPEDEATVTGSLGAIGSKYLDYLGSMNEVDRFYCECGVQSGDFKSVEECVAYIGGPTLPPMLADCYAQTFDDFEQMRDHVECQAEKFSTLLECLTDAGCGGDMEACEDQAFSAACPARPYEADAALTESCLGYSLPAPYECADGTKVLPWYECDFAADCPDGSDEYVECPGAYACAGGEIISQQWLCDGVNDCASGEDEASCP